jgi:L-histidine N-alpha-methyltransferase
MSAHQDALDMRIIDADPAFRRDVLNGLSARPRTIPARWFYDRNDSELFEAITQLPEYYVTRTELALLSGAVHEIAEITGPGRIIVEFGSCSSMKTRILLPAMRPAAYVPIDISREFLLETAAKPSRKCAELPIHPVEGDFTRTLWLPAEVAWKPWLGFFPGSTIGNLLVPEAVDLLRAMAATLGRGAMLLIGIDRIKDPGIVLPAYDDARGVTAAFNPNLVHRINRALCGTAPVDAFRHVARWNATEARIEMHLEAGRDIHFRVDGQTFSMIADETIHTENSHEYGTRDACVLLRAGGWTPIRNWTDSEEHFSLILAAEGSAPSVPCDDCLLENAQVVFSR